MIVIVTLENIRKGFTKDRRTVPVLDDVSLSLESGDFTSVQGRSGSGKTTLLLIAGGLLAPDAGTVTLADADLYSLSHEARARARAAQVGFVFQEFHLIPYLTVLENVLAPGLASPRSGLGRRALDLVEKFGLRERADHLPGQLSTGERQRTALARAMLPEPKLILADEPTGNLDEESGTVVLQALARFAGAGGAVLLVTHDKRTAAFAHREFLLRDRGLSPVN